MSGPARHEGLHVRDGKSSPEFARLMEKLANYYPNASIEAEQVVAYGKALGDIPLERLALAFSRAAQESRTFPSAAVLRSYVVSPTDDAGMLAWARLGELASQAGAWTSIWFEDGAVAQALEMSVGSWPDYCLLTDGPGMAIRRQEFLAAYRAARSMPGGRRPRQLPGLCGLPAADAGASVWCAMLASDGKILKGRAPLMIPAAASTGQQQPKGLAQ